MSQAPNNGYRHRIYDSIYVTPDGKVGIGTSQPNENLSVGGTVKVTDLLADSISSTQSSLQLQMPYTKMILK
jgi:hypothetical protein